MKIDKSSRTVDLDPRDRSFFGDPYPAYHAIRSAVPRFKWQQYGHWCFAAHEDVSALLRDRRFGRQVLHVMSRQELGWPPVPEALKPFYDFERHSLLENEPPVHTRLRSLVNRASLTRRIAKLAPRLRAIAHERIGRFASARQADVLACFAQAVPVIVITELLGLPASMTDRLLDWSHKIVAMYQFRRDEAIEREAVRATREFSAFMRGYVAERRSEPADDLLSGLIAAEDQGAKLSEDELVVTAILLLNAGHEATVHAIGNGIKALLEHRVDVGAAFAARRSALAHVEELLRFDAPLHLFTRYALEDVEWSGIRLRKGETVGLLLGAANRDPARFADPDRFDAGRQPNPHVSFGAGIHFCIGAPLARLELEVALPILFARLPGLRLAEAPRYRDSYHFHGLDSLKLEW